MANQGAKSKTDKKMVKINIIDMFGDTPNRLEDCLKLKHPNAKVLIQKGDEMYSSVDC